LETFDKQKLSIRYIPLEKLKKWPKNPKRHDLELIGDSIRQFGMRNPIAVNERNGEIEAGHGRIETLIRMRERKESSPLHIIEENGDWLIPVLFFNDDEITQAKYAIIDNQTTLKETWDYDLLSENLEYLYNTDSLNYTGFDEKDLQRINKYYLECEVTNQQEKLEQDNIRPTNELSELPVNDIIEDLIAKNQYFYFAFSGGKDSLWSLLKVYPLLKKEKKKATALFVDTGTEFPDILDFVYRTTQRIGIELQVLKPKKNFFDLFFTKKQFPNPITKECIDILIHSAMNEYCQAIHNENQKYVLIRGGRPEQRRRIIKKKLKDRQTTIQLQQYPNMLIFNPGFLIEKQEYQQELEQLPNWDGYGLGFLRTACWCCPFQKRQQWEAMKQYYPLLWDRMRELSKEMKYTFYAGDGYYQRFYEYWNDN